MHAGGGRPTEVVRRASAASCGSDWHFCEPGDPQAKGAVERLQGYLETNFEPGRRFANELDFQFQLDALVRRRPTRARTRRCGRGPIDRLIEERERDAAAARRTRRTSTGAG